MLMNARGFYPSHPCKFCGVILNENEPITYAGIYNGLCDKCTRSEPYLVGTHDLDSCQVWSHPPCNPSYRRHRQEYFFYSDCTKCNKGVIRKHERWNSYNSYCEECLPRYYNHTVRKKLENIRKTLRQTAQEIFELTKKETKYRKYLKKYKNLARLRQRQTQESLVSRWCKAMETFERKQEKWLISTPTSEISVDK